VRLSEAPSFGKSILEYASGGSAAQAYRALAREFIQRHASPATPRELAHKPASENLET
jgi:cellulose biosynthesis protein BcsQ